MRLQDKIAIVTGGGSGIGRATAEQFASEGARVTIADRHREAGQAVVAAITELNGEALFVPTDITQSLEVAAMVKATAERFGGVDVLFNCAGVQLHGQDARAHELSEEIWDHTFAINIRGMWLCAKYTIPLMLESGGGSIINLGSPTGLYGMGAGYTAYSASKSAAFGLTRVMAADYGRDNIRVNAIVPGATNTPLIATLLADGQTRAALERLSPLGRLGTPADVAALAVFLASDESRFCTGGYYMVDGGSTAM
jgi:NAD(P)-dependent dehydrogenase (short-subunit alcohol dehydrogenase family)